jgi:glutaminyl-tRNA synthetase
MKPDSEVRLMGAYIVKCNEVICDDEGNVKEIHCTADLETGCGMPVDGRKVKGTIHWVSESNCEDITVRLYDKLFTLRDTGDLPEGKTYADFMNPESVVELKHCKAEKGIGEGEADHFQFVRVGYFVRDSKDSSVYNRTVSLKDSYKPE